MTKPSSETKSSTSRASASTEQDQPLIGPYSPETEEALIGAACAGSERAVAEITALLPRDFYTHIAQSVAEAVHGVVAEGVPVHFLTIYDWLARHGKTNQGEITPVTLSALASGMVVLPDALKPYEQGAAIIRRCALHRAKGFLYGLMGTAALQGKEPDEKDLAVYRADIERLAGPASAQSSLMSAADFLQEPDIPDLVEKMLPSHGLAMCASGEGQLKSFTIDDLLFHVASGKHWHGRKIVKPGPVAFVLNEGYRGFKKRLRAWEQHHHCQIRDKVLIRKPDAQHLPFRLNDEADVRHLITDLQRAGVVAVCFDTLSSILPGVNPNGGDGGMLLALDHARRIETQAGALCLFAHHTNKTGMDVKGATDFIYGMDVRFSTKAEKDEQQGIPTQVTVHCEKPRDDEPFPDLVFSVHRVSVPTEDDPRSTSLVLEPDYNAAPARKTPKLTPNEEAAYQTLTAPLGWIAWHEKSGVPKGSWKRTVDGLCDKGLVQEPTGDGLYRRVPERLPVSPVSNRYHDTDDTDPREVSLVSLSLDSDTSDTEGDTFTRWEPRIPTPIPATYTEQAQVLPSDSRHYGGLNSAAPIAMPQNDGANALQPQAAPVVQEEPPAPATLDSDLMAGDSGKMKALKLGWSVTLDTPTRSTPSSTAEKRTWALNWARQQDWEALSIPNYAKPFGGTESLWRTDLQWSSALTIDAVLAEIATREASK